MQYASAQKDAFVEAINTGKIAVSVQRLPFISEDGSVRFASFSIDTNFKYARLTFISVSGDEESKEEHDATVKLALYVFRNVGYDLQAFAAEMWAIHQNMPF